MSKLTRLLVGTAVLALSTGGALADCRDELAMLRSGDQATGAVSGGHEGISKDGSLAPLEDANSGSSASATTGTSGSSPTTGAAGSADTASAGNADMTGSTSGQNGQSGDQVAEGGIVKDGDTMPLAQQDGGGDPNRAMSQQDAVSQQHGGGTAVTGNLSPEATASADGASGRQGAIQRAEAALAAGNEAECMQAVEEARSLAN